MSGCAGALGLQHPSSTWFTGHEQSGFYARIHDPSVARGGRTWGKLGLGMWEVPSWALVRGENLGT